MVWIAEAGRVFVELLLGPAPDWPFSLDEQGQPAFPTGQILKPAHRLWSESDREPAKTWNMIHVDGAGLVVLRKTCRMCVECDLVIAHQDEIELQLAAAVPKGAGEKPRYFVLGAIEPRVWRRGSRSPLRVDELIENMADFKAHMRLEYTPGGWRPAPKPAAKPPT